LPGKSPPKFGGLFYWARKVPFKTIFVRRGKASRNWTLTEQANRRATTIHRQQQPKWSFPCANWRLVLRFHKTTIFIIIRVKAGLIWLKLLKTTAC